MKIQPPLSEDEAYRGQLYQLTSERLLFYSEIYISIGDLFTYQPAALAGKASVRL